MPGGVGGAQRELPPIPITGERQPEVIQPMRERHARNRYAKRISFGEVRQAVNAK